MSKGNRVPSPPPPASPKSVSSFDTTAWPVVLLSVRGTPSDTEIDLRLVELGFQLELGASVGYVLDVSGWTGLPAAAQLKRMGEWLVERRSIVATRCAGAALVVPSALARAAVRAWLVRAAKSKVELERPPCPVDVFPDRERAERWVRARLRPSN